ncbi:hypothetical protein Desdi_0086 [Desulfitobacterium dichloroeliminans LMG P-21439]|uniref:DUF2520 domain-containing protein n=1 Tax=Desulfitobacterium dichloroeliminans (strain LMG P-21439 / DCA1) TaxID=871963 RepID=L0F1E0_DESDL|nr:Rossmann-like and DUF2520 domain-containing protein [Desulfitobacterium dichloroeliminans]AGA67659.1 hypothetical protein Desdi_0086 [Desulfitobacterium dichloroeliminans LMG P-21439]
MKFGIIGAGIVGTAIAIRLEQAGYRLVGVHTRSERSYQRFCHHLNWEKRPLQEWIAEADLVFITTQDGMIRVAAEELVQRSLYKEGQIWIHCSGSASSRVMQVNGNLPINYLSLHPLQAFAGIEQAVDLIPGTHFGIEGDKEDIGVEIVTHLGGIPHRLDPQQKPLYHAGAVVASNYLVTLAGMAVRLFEKVGINEKEALASLLPLMKGAIQNLENVGLPQALTGPIARGDADVIRGHLDQMPADIDSVYRALGLYTLEIGRRKMEMTGGAYAQESWEEMNRLFAEQDKLQR